MATTINSYSVGFGMDASGYIDGARISRSETRQLIKAIEEARTPAEKLAVEQNKLKAALDAGAISEGTYNRLLNNKRESLMGVIASSNLYTSSLTAIAAAGAAVVAGGVALVHHIRETQNAIDDTIDSAGKLGVSYNEIKSLRFAAQEGGGVDAATTDDAIKKLLVSTQKAVDGDQTTRDAFSRLGLDAGELIKQGPVKAVLAIADAMKNVETQGEKIALTMDIFGKSGTELVSTLDSGAAAISESIDFQQQWNALTDAQLDAVSANNDAWDRIGIAIEGVSSKLSAEAAPAMLLVAEYLLGAADKASGLDGFLQNIVTTSVVLVGNFQDITESATGLYTVLEKTASFDFAGAAQAAMELSAFDKTEQAMTALNEKRLEMENRVKNAEEEREKKRQQMLATEITMKETAAEKADKDRERREKAAEQKRIEAEEKREQKEKQREAEAEQKLIRKEKEDILKKAEEEVKKRMSDVAKGPGGGMEVGSAEAVKFFAQQRNAAIAGSMNQGEQTVLAEAVKQTQLLNEQKAKTEKQIALLDGILEQQKKNGFKRLR